MLRRSLRRCSPFALLGLAVLAFTGTSSATVTTTVRFDFTGAVQTFTVPAGVNSVHVVAIGGRGGANGTGVLGGAGAFVSADLQVTPGSTLDVRVGGNGGDGGGLGSAGGAGGFNGGGAGNSAVGNSDAAGGGGGATDIRTGAGLATRLLVAGGGGGAGGDYGPGVNAGGLGGPPGGAGANGNGPDLGGGGGAGTAGSGGAGGTPPAGDCGLPGEAGALGTGGAGGGLQGGPGGPGGGGGAGLNGGGGGASGCNGSSGGGGGGGASGGSAAATHVVKSTDQTGVPSLTISYTSASPAASVSPGSLSFATQPAGTVSAVQGVSVTNTGPAPLHVQGVTLSGAGAADYLLDASSCIAAVAPGGSCSIGVRFAPITAGTSAATMEIADDTGSSPHAVTLTGVASALPTGPAGSPGPPGPVTKALAVVIGAASFHGSAGRSVTVPYAASLPSTVTIELLKGRRIVLRKQATARAGRNKLKVTHLPKKAGRYTLKLIALTSDGQAASDQATVTIRAAKKERAKHTA